MFVLIGKLTSLGEVLQDFPKKDSVEYQEQTREMGSTFGTIVRVLLDYK